MPHNSKRQLNPRKLLLSKWSAVSPMNKEKHFIVTEVVEPTDPESPIEAVILQAVLTRRSETVAWKELTDISRWHQGWT